jgi:hypothetical protein
MATHYVKVLETGDGEGLAGVYSVLETHADGRLVLRPETSDEVIARFSDRVLSEDEALESLRRVHAAAIHEDA